MSINKLNFGRTKNVICGNGTDYAQPGKFIVGIDIARLGCDSA